MAYALSGASAEALALLEEVAFFQAVHISLGNPLGTGEGSYSARDLAVQQLIDRAVQWSEVVDTLAAAGLQRLDISILSEAFLAEGRA